MPERALYAEAAEQDAVPDVRDEIRITRWQNGEFNVSHENGSCGTFGSLPEALAYIRGLCASRPE